MKVKFFCVENEEAFEESVSDRLDIFYAHNDDIHRGRYFASPDAWDWLKERGVKLGRAVSDPRVVVV
jgi:hypothetical protein